jgi:hypothetical protein
MALIADDFVLYKEGGNIMSGGYSINSIFLKNGVSPMQTVNFRRKGLESNSLESDSKEKDGKNEKPHSSKISSLFEDLVIPAGLYFNNTKLFPENKIPFEEYKEHTMLPDDIFDKLFKMVEYEPNLSKTNKQNKYKKTKKGTSGTGLRGANFVKKGFTKKAKKD